MKSGLLKIAITIVAVVAGVSACERWSASSSDWTEADIMLLRSLWLDSLPDLPPDPSNAVADNPVAAQFGRQLFFDTRLSANGGISCATCHQLERRFTDGLQKAQAIGTTARHTPSIVGTAYSPWQFWDGRRDSQWAQALAPLEDANEHATDRNQVVSLIAEDPEYRSTYESLFGALPDLAGAEVAVLNAAFANIGKSIAAFERTIMPTTSRFDRYVRAVVDDDVGQQQQLLSDDEVRGLQLFISEASCTQCHNGPLFTNHEFHNTGVISFPGDIPDTGIELIGAFKTPSLRNLENTAPFMHKGQLATLADVLEHYNDAPDAMIGHNEAEPLGLNERELRQIEAFLATLAAPVAQLSATKN